MIGAGTYDKLCTFVRQATEADGVFLIIINGNGGSGSSSQATLEAQAEITKVLRKIADEYDKDAKLMKKLSTELPNN